MQNYLINENTIALEKIGKKTIVYDKAKIINLDISLKKILDYNCNYYGSSYEGRILSAKKILNIKYKLPIIIEENKNLILISLSSLRNNNCLLIMVNKILNYEKYNEMLKIECVDKIFYTKLSKYSFEKLFINAIRLNNILKSRKNVNFV